MPLSIGIIGLPNAGKSTLFNALLGELRAETAPRPFTTIEPNRGVVAIPDERLERIAHALKLPKKIPATIEFVDIAGLVRGAHKGEGLGNEFLSHIREVDAICHVVRAFEDPKVPHVHETIDPAEDVTVVDLELALKDLETVERALASRLRSEARHALEHVALTLKQGFPARSARLSEHDWHAIGDLKLLTAKPILLVGNVSEKDISASPADHDLPPEALMVAAKAEAELASLPPEERAAWRTELALPDLLPRLVQKAAELLCLISFYTLKPDQVQAWTTREGTKAPEAGGIIHTDFAEKFSAVEVVAFERLVKLGGFEEARRAGKVRRRGANYLIADGDVCHFVI